MTRVGSKKIDTRDVWEVKSKGIDRYGNGNNLKWDQWMVNVIFTGRWDNEE